MNPPRKFLLRTAERIREQLVRIRAPEPLSPQPEETWNRCSDLARQYSVALNRGWHGAAAIVRDRYRSHFNRLVEQLRELQNQFYDREPGIVPSLRQIYEELAAVDQEFGNLRIDAEASVIAISTDPIVLEEIDLGPFEVRLDWHQLGQKRCYDTVALNPNPPSGDEDVTHPHIRSNALCEGDGRASIERALRDGRLSDFFSIVNRILHTYSPGSPYVPLDQWNGVTCSDCGSVTDEDEATRCTNCSDALCLDCRTYCERCESDFCQSCVGSCSVCDAALCRGCQSSCACCGKRCCSGCLSDSDYCEECQNAQEPELDDLSNDDCEVVADSPAAAAPARAPIESPAAVAPI